MDKELKQQWIAALRSGVYEQGRGQLRTDGCKFCCLGVLATVMNEPLTEDGRTTQKDQESRGGGYDVFTSILGKEVVGKLYKMNDGLGENGNSFAEIADYIETNL